MRQWGRRWADQHVQRPYYTKCMVFSENRKKVSVAATQGMIRKYFEMKWRGRQDRDYIRLWYLTERWEVTEELESREVEG